MPFRCGSLSQVSDGALLSGAVRSTPGGKRRQGSTSSLNKRSRKPRTREAFRSIATGGDDNDPLSLVGTEFLVREYPLTVLERLAAGRNNFCENNFDPDQKPRHQKSRHYSPRRSDEDWIQHLQRAALQHNDCSRNDEETDSRQQKLGFDRVRNIMSSSSSASNTTPRNIHNKNSIHGKELQQKMIRKIHGKSRASAPLCPNCSGKLTYLYMSTNNQVYEVYDGNDSTKERLRRLLPPLCENCRTHLLFEHSKCKDLMMENFNEWLESGLNEDSDFSESNDDDQCGMYNYNDPRNAKLIVASSALACGSTHRDARITVETYSGAEETKTEGPTPRLGNLRGNSHFGFNDNGMRPQEDSPKFSDLSSLTDGHKVYQRKEGLYFERIKHIDNEHQQQSTESMPEEDRQEGDLVGKASQSDHTGRRNDLSPDYYSSDEDPLLDAPKDEDGCDETPPEPEKNTSRSDNSRQKCSDTCQQGGCLSEQRNVDQLNLISHVAVGSSHSPKEKNLASGSSESIKLIHTESEERAILEHYSMKKKVATVQIAKDLIRGHEVTSSECDRCKMPVMKKEGGALQCVTCPAIKKKAKRIAKQKRKGKNSSCLEHHDVPSAEGEIKKGVAEVGKLEESEPSELSDYVAITEGMMENTDGNVTSGKGEIDENAFSLTSDLTSFAVERNDGSQNANSFNKDSVSLANLEDMRNMNAMEEGLLDCNSLESGPLQLLGDCSDEINYGSYSESARDSNTNTQSANGLSWPQKGSSSSSSIYLNPNNGRAAEDSLSFNQSDYWTRHSSSQCSTTLHTPQPSAAVSSNSAIHSSHSYQPSIKSQQSAIEYSLSLYNKKDTIGKSSSVDQHGSSSYMSHYHGSSEFSGSFHSSDMQRYKASNVKDGDCQLQQDTDGNTPFHKESHHLRSSDSSSTQFVHNLPAGEIIHHCGSYPSTAVEVDKRTHGSQINQGSMVEVSPYASETKQSHVSSPDKMATSHCQQLYHCHSNRFQGLPSDMSCTSSTQCPRNLPSSEMIHLHPILPSEESAQLHPIPSSHQESLSTDMQPSCGLLSSDLNYRKSNETNPCQQSPQCERASSCVSDFQDSCASSTRCPNNLPDSEMIYHCPPKVSTGEKVCQSHAEKYQASTSETSKNKLNPYVPPSEDPHKKMHHQGQQRAGCSPHQVDGNGNKQYSELMDEPSSSACCQASSARCIHSLPSDDVIQQSHQPAATEASQGHTNLDHSNHYLEPMPKASSRPPKTQQLSRSKGIHRKPTHSHGNQVQKSSSGFSCDSPTQCPRDLPSKDMIHRPTQPDVPMETDGQCPLNNSNLYEDSSSEVSSMQMKLPVQTQLHQMPSEFDMAFPSHCQTAGSEADICHSDLNQKSLSDISHDKMSMASCEASSTRCPRNIPSSEMLWHHESHGFSSERMIHAQYTEGQLKDTTSPADVDGISKDSVNERQREDNRSLPALHTCKESEDIIPGGSLRDEKLDSIYSGSQGVSRGILVGTLEKNDNMEPKDCGASNEPLCEKYCHQLDSEESAKSKNCNEAGNECFHPMRGLKDDNDPKSQRNSERTKPFDTCSHWKGATLDKLGEASPTVTHTQAPPTSSWHLHSDQDDLCEDLHEGEKCLGPRKSVSGIFTFEEQENDNREDRIISASEKSVDEKKIQSIQSKRIHALAHPSRLAENQGTSCSVSTDHKEDKSPNNEKVAALYKCQRAPAVGPKMQDLEEAPPQNPGTIDYPKQKHMQVEESLGDKIAQLAASLQEVAGQLPLKDNHQHMVKPQNKVQNEPTSSVIATNKKNIPTNKAEQEKSGNDRHGMMESREKRIITDQTSTKKGCDCSTQQLIKHRTIGDEGPNTEEIYLHVEGKKAARNTNLKEKNAQPENVSAAGLSRLSRNRVFLSGGVCFRPRIRPSPIKREDGSCYQYNPARPRRINCEETTCFLNDNNFGISISPITIRRMDKQFDIFNGNDGDETTSSNEENIDSLFFVKSSPCSSPKKIMEDPPGRRGNSNDSWLRDPPDDFHPGGCFDSSAHYNSMLKSTIHRRSPRAPIDLPGKGEKSRNDKVMDNPAYDGAKDPPSTFTPSSFPPAKLSEIPPPTNTRQREPCTIASPSNNINVPQSSCFDQAKQSHSSTKNSKKSEISCSAGSTATPECNAKKVHDDTSELPPSSATPKIRGGRRPAETSKLALGDIAVASPGSNEKKCLANDVANERSTVALPHQSPTGEFAQRSDIRSLQILQEESRLNALSWEIDDVGVPLQTANSFGESSLGQLFKQIDEIEDDFNTIVASLPGSEGQPGSEGITIASSLKSTASDERELLQGSSAGHSLVEITFDTAGSFESNVSGDSMVTDVVQRMRRIRDYIEQVDSEDDGNGSVNSYDSEGEMSDLILRLTNAAESLRALHDDWDD